MTAVAPTFAQSGTLPLYALSSTGDAGLSGYWAGYRPGPQPAFTGTATLDQVWQDVGGSYVFAGRRPSDDAAFSQALDRYLAQASPTGLVRILWIADATVDVGSWQTSAVTARATGTGTGISWTVARSASLDVGEYGVTLAARAVLTPAAPALGFGIAVDALSFGGPATTCVSTDGTAWLPLAGPSLGAWRAELPLPLVPGEDALAGLRVGLRYAAPSSDGAPGDPVEIVDLPVIGQGAAALTLHLSFDWLTPLSADRTRAGFFDDAGTGDPGPVLAATLRTSRGYETTLAPRALGSPLRPARLVLCRTPHAVPAPQDDADWTYHLAPDGAFDLAVVPPPVAPTDGAPHRVMLGLSGQEYAALAVGSGATAFFAAGRPAFAPGAAPNGPPIVVGVDVDPLDERATTAHLALLPPTPGPGLAYYAQPLQAPLHAGNAGLGPGFLGYYEIAAATLPPWAAGATTPPAVVPGAPLAGVASDAAPLARRIEQAALAPARRQAIGLAPAELGADPDGGTTLTVTPQGLLVDVGPTDFERVVLACLPGTDVGQLDITTVSPELRGALQADQLFFVVGDPTKFFPANSVRYRLDETGLTVAANEHVPADVIARLRPIVLPGGVPKVFPTEAAFDEAVGAIAGTDWLPTLHEIAGFLKAELSGWTFQLSPRSWRTGPTDPTVMLFKYAHRSITDLVEDGAAWGWPDAAGDGQRELRRTIDATRARAEDPTVPDDDPYASFYRDVLSEPSWNGVLVLNAPVSLADLPPELQFMAAGIEPERFFAHHIGFAATPVVVDENDAIAVRQTAAFGLIDYQDPVDLVLRPEAPNPDFGFKTLTLTARFAGAVLTGFSARLELMVNRLLGARLIKRDPTHGNNLLLTGSTQRQGGVLSYAFVLEGEHVYRAARTVLDSVQIDTVRILTGAHADTAGDVVTTFALGGFLRFLDDPAFDMFAYGLARGEAEGEGRLRIDDLAVRMRFPLGSAHVQHFDVGLDGVRLDPSRSAARERSLVRNFPVALTGLTTSATRSPQDAGFASIAAPIDQTPLDGEWWALSYRLDLGTLGALAGSTGLSLTLIAAWGAGTADDEHPLYVGLQLPGGMQWSLQGVVKLGFRSFQFETGEAEHGLAYVLRMRRFALSVLGLSLPPGNVDLALFGDPGHPETRVVGWYGAYQPDPPKKKQLTR